MRPPTDAVIFAALAALALAACQRSRGDSTAEGPPPKVPAEALAQVPLGNPPGQPAAPGGDVANPYEGNAQAVQEGKALYGAMNCAYCHADGGAGLIGPPLNGPGWRYGGTPADLYKSIHDGRPQGMPAWGARLPPDQIWKLVAYIESLGGASPPATSGMAALASPQPSATGPEPAQQSQTDTADAAIKHPGKPVS